MGQIKEITAEYDDKYDKEPLISSGEELVALLKKENIGVLFQCDFKKCKTCLNTIVGVTSKGECKHTTDINHARNFKGGFDSSEIERVFIEVT